MDVSSTTINASIDSRPQILIQNLPSTIPAPAKENKTEEKTEEKPETTDVKN